MFIKYLLEQTPELLVRLEAFAHEYYSALEDFSKCLVMTLNPVDLNVHLDFQLLQEFMSIIFFSVYIVEIIVQIAPLFILVVIFVVYFLPDLVFLSLRLAPVNWVMDLISYEGSFFV